MVKAICKELSLLKNFWREEKFGTIYFGGGTPSVLPPRSIEEILQAISNHYSLQNELEITLESNPDDIGTNYLSEIHRAGVNRISLGIQTFDDKRLKFINRAHTGKEAKRALANIHKSAFSNFSVDLIYAIPPDDIKYWARDLETALGFEPPHISLYGMSIEEKTVFGNWKKNGKYKGVSEETATNQYKYAIETLASARFHHYEVSNFAISGFESKHNNAYWQGQSYLGIGPGAHSYNGKERWHNINHNPNYIKSILKGELPRNKEKLTLNDQINEHLFTRLRTSQGIDLAEFRKKFNKELTRDREELLKGLGAGNLIKLENGQLRLTPNGFLLADEITCRMFYG